MKPIIFKTIICLLLISFRSQMLESKDPVPVHNITVVLSDTIIRTSVLNSQFPIKIQADCIYFWFHNNTIQHNRGGYSGKLLHGKYELFDKANRLLLSGRFEYGLKEGDWIIWYSNGLIKEHVRYKSGKIDGTRIIYNSSGDITSQLKYRKDLLDGESRFYRQDTIIRTRYRNGEEKIRTKKEGKNKTRKDEK